MTLEELRTYLQGNSEDLKELQAKIEKKKVASDPEIEEIRKERQILKLQNEKGMEDLMKVLATRHDKELRNKIEKDKIAAELKALDNDKFSGIEKEKREELERLEAERVAIRKKEESLMNEIQALSLKAQPESLKKDKKESMTHQELIRRRELDFAKEKAETIAKLRLSSF